MHKERSPHFTLQSINFINYYDLLETLYFKEKKKIDKEKRMDSILKKERVVYCSINAVKSNIKKKKECIQKRRNKNMKHFGVSKRGKNRISLVCF